MRFILFISLIFFALTSPLEAMVQTDTHTYILDVDENNLLAIDRRTGDERCLHLGGILSRFIIYKDKGYIVDIESNYLIIIDLPKFAVVCYLNFGCTLESLSIQNGLGYLNCYNIVCVLDLENERIVQKIPMKPRILFLEIQGTKGYVGHMNDDALTVIDFSLGKVTGTIKVGPQPQLMMVHKGKGYVSYARGVAVIDLENDCILFYLDLKQTCKSWAIQGDYAYGVGLNTFYRIDLGTHKVTQLTLEGNAFEDLWINKDHAYLWNSPVRRWYSKNILVIDLKTLTILRTIDNPKNCRVDFSDRYLYFGSQKKMLLFQTKDEMRSLLKETMATRFRTSYKDSLDFKDLAALLMTQEPLKAWDLFLTLYQPLAFFDSPAGHQFYVYISSIMPLMAEDD